jgi:putative ABC transport system permease protein
MKFLALVIKSAFRNQLRTFLTSVGVALTIVAFLFLRTFIAAWYASADGAASDRLVMRNKTAIIFSMPLAYVDKVKKIPDVSGVGYFSWFGGYYKDPKNFFVKFAASDSLFDLLHELIVDPAQKQAFKEDKQGVMVGSGLADKFGWKIGDRITITGDLYPGEWEFNVRAIYHSNSRNFDEQYFYFHWSLLDDRMDERRKSNVGMILLKVSDASKSAQVAAAVDQEFANSVCETRTESEKAFLLSFISMSSALVGAIQAISGMILLILGLILANTLAMATRERTSEYATMRAIGFRPRHIVGFVLGESFVIAGSGVLLGVSLATPVLKFFASFFQSRMGAFFGEFALDPRLIVQAAFAAVVAGMLAAALPAWRASRMPIVDALRRVG